MNSVRNHRRGFSMVEVLVALSILSVVIIGVVHATVQNVRLSRFATEDVQATYLLEEGIEAVKLLRDDDWVTITDATIGTSYYLVFVNGMWTLSTTPQTDGMFTRTVTFDEVLRDINDDIAETGSADDQARHVTVTVTWSSAGTDASRDMEFIITDFFTD